MSKYQLVTIAVDGTVTREDFAKRPDLKPLQKAVGGYIERIKVRFEGKVREAYANEDGFSLGLGINREAGRISAEFGYQGIVGPIAIIITGVK